jgi:hypothetical protein
MGEGCCQDGGDPAHKPPIHASRESRAANQDKETSPASWSFVPGTMHLRIVGAPASSTARRGIRMKGCPGTLTTGSVDPCTCVSAGEPSPSLPRPGPSGERHPGTRPRRTAVVQTPSGGTTRVLANAVHRPPRGPNAGSESSVRESRCIRNDRAGRRFVWSDFGVIS